MVEENISLNGNDADGFINGLVIADNSVVTIYIAKGKTLTVTGQDADGQHGAGAGIYVPSSSTLYITGKGTLNATGGKGGNGGNGGNSGTITADNQNMKSGDGGSGGYGGGGGAAAIGGNGGAGGAEVAGGALPSSTKQAIGEGTNGFPNSILSTECNGKSGMPGETMGKVYILGDVIINATAGGNGESAGNAGTITTFGTTGKYYGERTNNNRYVVGAGGAGAGGGAGIGATYAIGGGGAGAGGGAAGGSGAIDSEGSKVKTNLDNDLNGQGRGSSGLAGGEGSIVGTAPADDRSLRDNGSTTNNSLLRYGGYGGSVGGAAGAQGGNGTTYALSSTINGNPSIGNLQVITTIPTDLDVNIRLNYLNDKTPSSGTITVKFGESYPTIAKSDLPTRPGYDFAGYFYNDSEGNVVQMYDKDGAPTANADKCLFVQSENPTFNARWVLTTYTVTWNYKYYIPETTSYGTIPVDNRSHEADIVINLLDNGSGHNTYTYRISNPDKSLEENSKKITLKEVLPTDIFSRVIAVESVTPIDENPSSSDRAYISLDYVNESSAKIFYDPTRYMVKWSVTVNSSELPEYIIATVKRGIDGNATGSIEKDGTYKEDPTLFEYIRLHKNSEGKYEGSAVLRYEQATGKTYTYSLDVVGVRDDYGHDVMFSTPISSASQTNGTMACNKPTDAVPTPTPTRQKIEMTINLNKLTFNPKSGMLGDATTDTPDKIWEPAGTTVSLTPATYPATRLNYAFKGWDANEAATDADENITLNTDKTVYAVWKDETPPTITFGSPTININGGNRSFTVPVTVTDAIANYTMQYVITDTETEPTSWPTSGTGYVNLTKKAETTTVNSPNYATTARRYLYVKATDAAGNTVIAHIAIDIDTKAPVIEAIPNYNSVCKEPIVVSATDDVAVTVFTVNGTSQIASVTSGFTLTVPTGSNTVATYEVVARDAAGNETTRTFTIYKEHLFNRTTAIPGKEPTEGDEGFYSYYKCEHCSKVIVLVKDPNSSTGVDIDDETQRKQWIIPSGEVLIKYVGSDYNEILDHQPYINEAIRIAYAATTYPMNATPNPPTVQANTVKLTAPSAMDKNDSDIAFDNSSTKPIILDLNGQSIQKKSNGQTYGNITGRSNITVLLTDNGVLPYTNKSPISSASPIKYVRAFTATQAGVWQALYLPFTFNKPDGCEVAKLKSKEEHNNETADGELVLIVEPTTTYTAKTPLFIKTTNDEAHTLTITGSAGLPAATSYSENVTSESGFDFIGTMYDSPVSAADGYPNFWVLLNNGEIWWAADGQKQRPYRWAIRPNAGNAFTKVRMSFDEYETSIDDVEVSSNNGELQIYTLDGRKINSVDSLQRGVYIVNGKKVFIK